MEIALRWVGTEESEKVALTRMRCYAQAEKELDRFHERTQSDIRAKNGDYLLAELDGEPIGTATSLSMKMWLRGAALPCQGVAWVGAIKTMRRRGGDSAKGIASTIMHELLRQARAREEVVSALMPFRASFYEHFGYGIVEGRNEWMVPMALLPNGPFDSLRFYEAQDFAARAQCLREVNQTGQCDIERSDEYWTALGQPMEDGFQIVDRSAKDGRMDGWMYLLHKSIDGQNILHVADQIFRDPAALRRQLHFLASLKDQYTDVQVTLPVDLPLNLLLKEPQLPHRPVSHSTARLKPITRMQTRVLDHVRFLQALNLPAEPAGKAAVVVHECEGEVKRFSVEFSGGKAVCRPHNSTADFECADHVWASVACGNLRATQALRWGLASGSEKAAEVLDVLAVGPAPFCNEYF